MASKYDPLARYLRAREENTIQLTFGKVEEIVGDLPPAARKHRAWWSNNDSNTSARNGWLAAGWKTSKVDMDSKELVFYRDFSRPLSGLKGRRIDLGMLLNQMPYYNDTAEDLIYEIIMSAGGIENLTQAVRAIEQYISGDIVETELGRILRKIWSRKA